LPPSPRAASNPFGPIDLIALRDIHNGLSMFVSAGRTDFLIAKGLASRRLDGRTVLTEEGLRRIEVGGELPGRKPTGRR
jgi:hypothetical protein